MTWEEEGIKRLKESLYPIPSEKNGIDWKSSLSDDSDRLAKHISACANNNGGGFFAFGHHVRSPPSLLAPQPEHCSRQEGVVFSS